MNYTKAARLEHEGSVISCSCKEKKLRSKNWRRVKLVAEGEVVLIFDEVCKLKKIVCSERGEDLERGEDEEAAVHGFQCPCLGEL